MPAVVDNRVEIPADVSQWCADHSRLHAPAADPAGSVLVRGPNQRYVVASGLPGGAGTVR